MDEAQGRSPESTHTGLDLEGVWELVGMLHRQEGFITRDGLTAKSLLDYPGGFRFSGPRGAKRPEAAEEFFLSTEPVYVLWSTGGGVRPYTVGWQGKDGEWHSMTLDEEAPEQVRRHQWLVRVLTMPGLEWKGVAG